MGTVANITHDKFPRQGDFLGRDLQVFFHYDSDNMFHGQCVRDDAEEPYLMIIALEDGRHVMSTECQYGTAEPNGVFMNEIKKDRA